MQTGPHSANHRCGLPGDCWTEWKDLARSRSVDIRPFAHGVVDVRRACTARFTCTRSRLSISNPTL